MFLLYGKDAMVTEKDRTVAIHHLVRAVDLGHRQGVETMDATLMTFTGIVRRVRGGVTTTETGITIDTEVVATVSVNQIGRDGGIGMREGRRTDVETANVSETTTTDGNARIDTDVEGTII
jgi:hypothetical protein